MVPLAADRLSERAEYFVSAPQAIENMPEIEAWRPTKLIASTTIDVHAIDACQHSPAALAVHILVVGEQAPDDARRIRPES